MCVIGETHCFMCQPLPNLACGLAFPPPPFNTISRQCPHQRSLCDPSITILEGQLVLQEADWFSFSLIIMLS